MGRMPPRIFTRPYEAQNTSTPPKRPRLFEGDRIRFPMEGVTCDLHIYIMEKILYTEFANFNSCNTFSAGMCNSLPSNVKLPFNLDRIYIMERARGYDNREALRSPKSLARCLPKNIHYICDKLVIENPLWEMVKDYKFTTKQLNIYEDATPSKMREMLQVTKPTSLYCSKELKNEVLSFPELTQLNVFSFVIEEISDEELLSLQMPFLNIGSCAISLDLLTKFLHQWFLGERTISHVEMNVMQGYTINELIGQLNRTEENFSILSGGNEAYWICKTEDHSNCICVQLRPGAWFEADGEKKCICSRIL